MAVVALIRCVKEQGDNKEKKYAILPYHYDSHVVGYIEY